MIIPILGAILSGTLCGLLGYYVQRFGITTISFTIAHAALASAAISMVLKLDITLYTIIFTIPLTLIIAIVTCKFHSHRELLCLGLFSLFNAIAILMGIELMLNAVNVNLLAFWRYLNQDMLSGQVFVVIVFAVAAAEVSVGLALIISVFRNRKTIVADDIDLMKW